MGETRPPRTSFETFINSFYTVIESPVVWFRGKVVANRPEYYWYHQKFRRVPTIDECYTDDMVCYIEANKQFRRDRAVDTEVLSILRCRFEDCILYESPNKDKCKGLWDQYQEASENWFIKYGDLGAYGNAEGAYMKQKHRMIWERRHGPVGSGMRSSQD